MQWPALSDLLGDLQLPPGYAIEPLRGPDVPAVVRALRAWYPAIVVGMESCHLRERFYYDQVQLAEAAAPRDVLALVLRHAGDQALVGLLTLERNTPAQTLTSRMGALAPAHRRAALGALGPLLLEAAARRMGAGLAYYFATLQSRHQQLIAERAGFQLVGIVPAYDLDMVAPDAPQRVFEALYAKVLAPPGSVYTPPREALTATTRRLWDVLFGAAARHDAGV
jgi:hypothetical protein